MPSELGATFLGDGRTEFVVWAPRPERVEVHLVAPEDRVVETEDLDRGYRRAIVEGVEPGARYVFRLDGRDVADPASLATELTELRLRLLADPYFQGVPSMQPEEKKTALAFHERRSGGSPARSIPAAAQA